MIKPMFVAAWFACCALLVIAPEGAVASAVGVQPQKPAVRDTDGAPARHVPPAPDTITVVLLGTGVGPPVNLQQYGPSTLVEAGGQRLLFDCGRGATFRIKQAGVPLGSISRVFLTHLHSDHIIQLPDLLLAGWVAGRHAVPLEVWGPAGTRAMMDHLQQAFAFDIHMRRDVDEHFPAAGIRVVSHEVQEGVVFDEHGVTVTAFLVDHGPVRPAFGYRIDTPDRSIVVSGDTRPSPAIAAACNGCDVLIHEVYSDSGFANMPVARQKYHAQAHTSATQLGTIATAARPKLLILTHILFFGASEERVLAEVRSTFKGNVVLPRDLQVF